MPAGLIVSAPGDRYEEDAERKAREVLRPSGAARARSGTSSGSPSAARSSGVLGGVLGTGGRPLPEAVRRYFEPRFGHDFGRVRVHTDGTAARATRAMGARAVTAGQDVILAEGNAAPETDTGRQLLAHELAHVVQHDAGDRGPLLRPRLIVTGGAADLGAFFGLLGPATGLALKRDARMQVTGTPSSAPPRSQSFAEGLKSIMADPQQDAELHLGRTQEGISFGGFPADLEAQHLVQEIRIDQLVALEKGAPGAAVSILAHEIFENFHAHSAAFAKKVREGMRQPEGFKEAHRAAIAKEEAVVGELGFPGTRHAMFTVMMGREPHRFFRWIRDMEQYYVIWNETFDDPGNVVSNARRVPPLTVATYPVKGLGAMPGKVSGELSRAIGAAVADLTKDPTTSARIQVQVSVYDVARPTPDLALEFAETIQHTLETELDSRLKPSDKVLQPRSSARGEFVGGDVSSVTITVTRPKM
jgi:hypothetical protein